MLYITFHIVLLISDAIIHCYESFVISKIPFSAKLLLLVCAACVLIHR